MHLPKEINIEAKLGFFDQPQQYKKSTSPPVLKYIMKVKLTKYLIQMIVIWNNSSPIKWGVMGSFSQFSYFLSSLTHSALSLFLFNARPLSCVAMFCHQDIKSRLCVLADLIWTPYNGALSSHFHVCLSWIAPDFVDANSYISCPFVWVILSRYGRQFVIGRLGALTSFMMFVTGAGLCLWRSPVSLSLSLGPLLSLHEAIAWQEKVNISWDPDDARRLYQYSEYWWFLFIAKKCLNIVVWHLCRAFCVLLHILLQWHWLLSHNIVVKD